MTCSRCKKKEVVELPYVNQSLCEECFVKFFEKRVRKTIRRHELLETDDKVAVALSGGKDSMTALTILEKLSKKAPKSELFAIIINEGSGDYRDKLVATAKEYCDMIKVPCHVFSFKEEVGATIEEVMKRAHELDNTMPSCSYCGVFRRQILNQKARELGATKLVTGHNLDDECQTGIMNFVRGDAYRIARAGAKVGMIGHEKFVPRIKPLRETPEAEIKLYTQILEIPTAYCACPYSTDAFRVSMKKVVLDLEKKYPGTRYQTIASIDALAPILQDYYSRRGMKEPNICDECGEVCSGNVCKFCQMLEELGLKQ
jgi:uncharacterized protein (TIGR00269 family)